MEWKEEKKEEEEEEGFVVEDTIVRGIHGVGNNVRDKGQ